MVTDLSIPEPLVEQFLDLYVEELWGAKDQWVNYLLVPAESSMLNTRSAREAARRIGIAVHVDVMPEDYTGAPVRPSRGHVVIRIGDSPAPWQSQ